MCAINGFNFKDEKLIGKMNAVTKHRGPDASGIFVSPDISLGNNRLSIIDLSSEANQPMKSIDGRYIIVYNGELYNFQDLKKELRGYSFKTRSDTEVILAAYQKWGEECVKRFDGIFAFAIWDTQEKALFLARDHIGVKPLYYFSRGTQIIFSSEIKAILEHDVPRKLDPEAFNHYLRVLYVPEPYTMFAGIRKLPPAHYALIKRGMFSIVRYWECQENISRGSLKEHSEKFLNLLDQAVEKQLVSDRPVGVYLSGGMDSSGILDILSRRHKKIDTFSIGFELSKHEQSEKFNADFNLARRTAEHYDTNHYEVLVASSDIINYFEQALWHLDEPISNPTMIPMLKLADYAKKYVTVVLVGNGGDELFGGYERYRLSLLSSYYRRLPKTLRGLFNLHSNIRKLDTSVGIERFAQFMFQKEEVLNGLITAEYLNKKSYDFFDEKYFMGQDLSDFEKVFMRTDRQSWLVDESLMLTDKMSMAAGLEARVPILDKQIVEFAESLPRSDRVTLFETKRLPKYAFQYRLPKFLYNQPKRGWFSPAAKWLRRPHVDEYAREVLSSSFYEPTAGLFNWPAIARALSEHRTKKRYNLTLIWTLLTFQVWARKFQVTL